MKTTRREWMWSVGAAMLLPRGGDPLASRVAQIVEAYSDQGMHRTGTSVDDRSARWLAREASDAGVSPAKEAFPLSRVDVLDCRVDVGRKRIPAIPLFDGTFTSSAGVRGRLGALGGATEIPIVDLVPNQAAAGPLGEARRRNVHRAIVCATRGGRPGLCPSNADSFDAPFGPPVVQVSSDDGDWLTAEARRGAVATIVAHVRRTPASALNIVATLPGRDPGLPPLVVMTPRSGWYACASERGGGIACWIELMRALKARSDPLPRDVLFVASSGHELGHLGINAFAERRPDIVRNSAAWIHLGANIGAATDPGVTIQASDDRSESVLTTALSEAGIGVDRRVPRGTVPNGEAELVHRGGGTYVSVIGRNALFHNPLDRGANAVDPQQIARFVNVFVALAASLAG